MDETAAPASPSHSVEGLDEQLRQLTLAVAELASIQTDMMRSMERASRTTPSLGGVNLGIGGALGQSSDPHADRQQLAGLRSRAQSVLSWLIEKAKRS